MIRSPHYDLIHNGKLAEVRIWMDREPQELNSAVAEGYTPLQIAVMHGQAELVSFFVDRMALVNKAAENPSRTTALHLGVAFRDESLASKMVEVLVANGAELNAQDANGETALHHAVARGSVKLVQDLVILGADPFMKDGQARTASDLVAILPESLISADVREAMRAGLKRAFSLPLE